jgi:hypothetical protein
VNDAERSARDPAMRSVVAASLVGEAPEQIERALANIRIGDLGECCRQLNTFVRRQKSPEDMLHCRSQRTIVDPNSTFDVGIDPC